MATAAAPEGNQQPRQNWIVGRTSDMLLIIVAPALAFLWSVAIFVWKGPLWVWGVFMVFNVAHHFPTFIRIYGDRDCFRRFRWSLLLGPVLPFTVAMIVAGYIITDPDPSVPMKERMGHLMFLWMVLTIWDPWHFLMQHYGFMRIYDRHNQAPRKLAAWMDYLVSATWFIFIMMAAVQWFCGQLLYTLYNNHGVPILSWISPGVYSVMLTVAFAAATCATIAYVAYVLWCRSQGFFVSYAKLALLACTFGVMYFTYVPSDFLLKFFPGWTFATGFATLGMVHVTQYLAIVWKYNRSLAKQGKRRARSGLFMHSFARGGLVIVLGYVAICLLYGAILSQDVNQHGFKWARGIGISPTTLAWCFAVLWSVGFTSTFTHYYYDGFIWKVRHKENRENLAMQQGSQAGTSSTEEKASASWWERGKGNTMGATFLRQLVYFGVPLALLIYTYTTIGQSRKMPLTQLRKAEQMRQQGRTKESIQVATAALDGIEKQKGVVSTVSQLDKRSYASHATYLADLTYWSSKARLDFIIRPQREPSASEIEEHRQGLSSAIDQLAQILELTDVRSYGHREFTHTRDELELHLARWRKELAELKGNSPAAVRRGDQPLGTTSPPLWARNRGLRPGG